MNFFLLYYLGTGSKPQADVAAVRQIPGVAVVSEPSLKSVLLDISEELVAQRVRHLPGWTLQAMPHVPRCLLSRTDGAAPRVE